MKFPRYVSWVPGPVRAVLGALVATALALSAQPAAAQQGGTVSGAISDAGTGRGLPSVQVYVEGTGIGTLSNEAGRFLLLNVPVGDIELRAELVGYRSVTTAITVTAGETAIADITMSQTAIALDQIVVTGAGQQTEIRKLGNTIATIDSGDLEGAAVSTVSEILTGREPGLVGLPSGGLTGEGARIRIRGSASLSQSNEPIIYVDGVRVDRSGGFGELQVLSTGLANDGVGAGGGGSPSRLDDLNPDAIDRIEVLKGPAAATLYGSEASNGVIQIFTKSGVSGQPRWTLTSEFGVLNYPSGAYKPNAGFARDDEQLQNMRELFGRPDLEIYEVLESPITEDFLYETGQFTTQSLSLNGGTSAITYFLSGRYQFEDGPFGASDLCEVGCGRDRNQRIQGSATINVFPHENLRIRVSTNYSDVDQETPNTNNNIFGVSSLYMFSQPQLAECNNSSIAGLRQCSGAGNPTGAPAFATPREAIQVETRQNVQHFTGSLGANWEAVNGLNFDATVGIDFVNQLSSEFKPFGYDLDGVVGDSPDGERFVNDRNAKQITLDLKGVWNTAFADVWSSTLTLGGQGFLDQVDEKWGSGDIFPGPGFEVVGAGATLTINEGFRQVVNAGWFIQEQLGYDDWAFLTVGGRLDFNSAFGETETGEFYPKASLSIVPSSLGNWTSSTLSSFRLRGAIGQSGLQPGAFDKFTTFQSLSSQSGAGVAPNNLGNDGLRPEVATEWEAGAELGFFQDRLGLQATYWNRTVKDALVARQFPLTGGFVNPQLDNIGQIDGEGVELTANAIVYESADLSIDVFANAAYLNEVVTDMGGAPDIKSGGSYTRYRNFIQEGAAPGAFFGAKLLDTDPGFLPIDLDGDGLPDAEDAVLAELDQPFDVGRAQFPTLLLADDDGDEDVLDHFLGKPSPDWQGAVGLNVSFLTNFSLSTMFEYKAGNFQILNLTDAFRQANPAIGRNIRATAEVESTMLNESSTAEQRLDALKTWMFDLVALAPQSGLNSIESADWVRWRELSLTYDLPSRLFATSGIDGLSLTVTGRNLRLWSGYSGVDPEANAIGRGGGATAAQDNNFLLGTEAFPLPLPTRWTVSARLRF